MTIADSRKSGYASQISLKQKTFNGQEYEQDVEIEENEDVNESI